MDDKILVVHINKDRYESLRAQSYPLLKSSSEKWGSIVARLGGGDTLYHLLDSDEGQCPECFRLRTSVKPETPADMEMIKQRLRYGPFPTITIDRNGFDMDLAALEYLNHQMELARAMGDYVCVNVNIQRLPVERFCGSVHSSITFPVETD